MARQLFIAGCGRSGTTALTTYLNDHPRVCVTTERYKFIPDEVSPEMLSFERILEYSSKETNLPESRYRTLLAEKDEASLWWVGDKVPNYSRYLDALAANNPDGAILFTYRPLAAVAASYAARSRDPEDSWLGGKNGAKLAVRDWNQANRAFRRFCLTHPRYPVLVVDYVEFFARPKRSARILKQFLGVDFGSDVVSRWQERSAKFTDNREAKLLTEEERCWVEDEADRQAKEWVLGFIAAQGRILSAGNLDPKRTKSKPIKFSTLKKRIKKFLAT